MLKLVVFVSTRNISSQFKTKKRENTNCQQLDFLLFLCSVFVFHSVHNDNNKNSTGLVTLLYLKKTEKVNFNCSFDCVMFFSTC
jgi:hypothetical protein